MSDAPTSEPHWSIPHVIGVVAAVLVYIAIFVLSGDSDLLIAIAAGAFSMLGTWVYLFSGLMPRKK